MFSSNSSGATASQQGLDPSEEEPWEDEITCIMLQDIMIQNGFLRTNVCSILYRAHASHSMWMMLEVVKNLMKIDRSIGPLSSLWATAC